MIYYFIFIFVTGMTMMFSHIIKAHGFDKLSISRTTDKSGAFIGEKITVVTTIENRKRIPVSFLVVNESMPMTARDSISTDDGYKESAMGISSTLSVGSYERIRRKYAISCNKRGTYVLNGIDLTIGDAFGLSGVTKEEDNRLEFLVYPQIINPRDIKMDNTSLMGDVMIKRWIHKDPMYVKGIREYNRAEDRMKDIHWNSSLRMNKLMVREYDFTCERDVIFIVNVQCGEPAWCCMDEGCVERAIKLAASMINCAVKQGVPAGIWTNSEIMSGRGSTASEIQPSVNSFMQILELCARMDCMPKASFEKYLSSKIKHMDIQSTYVIVTPYMSEGAISITSKLLKQGFSIKLIDVSRDGSVPNIKGLEKFEYRGDCRNGNA